MTPIETINAEMQKAPNNKNLERVGHYLIDKGIQTIPEGKTLAGCLSFCKGRAQKQASNGIAMIEDEEVFAWIDEYYGLQHVEKAVSKAPVKTDMMELADFF